MKTIEIKLVQPHPVNAQIYGDVDVETMGDVEKIEFMALVDSIRRQGILNPIVIDQNYTIISGERRYNAALFLEMDKIPCRQYRYENDLQRLDHLLGENITRVKTNVQRIREGEIREKILLADKKAALKASNKSTIRDIVGDLIGMSGKTFAVGKDVLTAVDKLNKEGETEKAKDLKDALNKSVSGAIHTINEVGNKEEVPADFWYKPKLKAMINLMARSLRSIHKEAKSDTPSAFMWFLKNVATDLKRYESWLDNMENCTICNGTMYLKSGAPCPSCIKGQVGKYTIEEDV